MHRKKTIASLVIVLCLIAGCSKDHALPSANDCYNFELPSSGIGPLYGESRYQFKAPCFNPANTNEFCYLFIDNQTGENKLCKFNLLTQSKTDLLSNYQIILQPKWSKKDWILFNTLDHNFWKIKSNGDSLIQLTFSSQFLYPEWSPDGSKFICHLEDNLILDEFIYDESAELIDTLPGTVFLLGSWSSDDKIVTLNGGRDDPNLHYSFIDNVNWVQITDYSGAIRNQRIEDIKWHPSSQDVFYTRWLGGLYKVNIQEKKEHLVVQGCDSKSYEFISISNDGEQILAERINATFDNPVITQNSKIYVMNIDGSDEHEIILPTD